MTCNVKRVKASERKQGQPIIMENGKIIKLDETMIGSQAIIDGMKYVSKMTAGLATGSMSMDSGYIEWQKKIIGDLIKEQAEKTKKAIESEEKTLKNKYSNAAQIQEDSLKRIQEHSRRIAEDNTITFYIGEDDDLVYHVGTAGPIGVNDSMGGGYKRIDFKELKKLSDARREKAVVREVANAKKKEVIVATADIVKKKTKKKAKKKTKKKKVATRQSKKSKAKKGDRK